MGLHVSRLWDHLVLTGLGTKDVSMSPKPDLSPQMSSGGVGGWGDGDTESETPQQNGEDLRTPRGDTGQGGAEGNLSKIG